MEKYIKDELDKMPETELADVIYVFIPTKQFGIRFYSRSPRNALKDGIFETDMYSISKAEWDDNVNLQNGPVLMRIRNGEAVVSTYIVSEHNFMRLLDEIKAQKENEKITINITQNKLTQDSNDYNKNEDRLELEQMKTALLNIITTSNSYKNSENKGIYEPYFDENKNIKI